MTATITKISKADTLRQFGIVSCDFVFTPKNGVEFTVWAQAAEPNTATNLTPLFDYNNDEHCQAIKDICLAIVDDAFPDIHNISEVGGNFYPDEDQICFEGEVTTVLNECAYIS